MAEVGNMNERMSRNRHWVVSEVSLDGQRLFRVLHDSPFGVPLHTDSHRTSLVRMAGGWYWAGDYRSRHDVELFVPLSELEEVMDDDTSRDGAEPRGRAGARELGRSDLAAAA